MGVSTEQVAEGVHRVADGMVNWYLVEDAGRVAIVDAGWPRSWPRMAAAISQIGRSTADVDSVLLTHGHADHLGAAERARTKIGVPVRANRTEVGRVTGVAKGSSSLALVPGLVPQLRRPAAVKFVLHATVQGFLWPTWVEEVNPFDVGDELDAPGRPRVVATPGHTAGHVSFHLPSRGVLISGDSLTTLDPITGARGPQVINDVVNSDPALTRASLAAIEAIDADTLLPGHGDPWRGGMAEAVARARAADAGG
jgi:glyoxylase-like metal-dependent hydrolase (beta-lactamase superfamily II)